MIEFTGKQLHFDTLFIICTIAALLLLFGMAKSKGWMTCLVSGAFCGAVLLGFIAIIGMAIGG